MAPIPLKHSREESHTSSSSRPTKVPRGGGSGLDKDRAIVLGDSDDDNDSDPSSSSDGGVTLVDQKPVRNTWSTEVCHNHHLMRLRYQFLKVSFEKLPRIYRD